MGKVKTERIKESMEIRRKTERKKKKQIGEKVPKGDREEKWDRRGKVEMGERERRAYIEERGIRQREIKGKGENNQIWERICWKLNRNARDTKPSYYQPTKLLSLVKVVVTVLLL